jgi:hypothetical protein
MLEVLNKYLNSSSLTGCITAQWISTLSKDEQQLFKQIKENSTSVSVAHLFHDLNKDVELPFKLTAFRSHLRGYCTCR